MCDVQTHIQVHDLQTFFSPVTILTSLNSLLTVSSFNSTLHVIKNFNFYKVNFINFFHLWIDYAFGIISRNLSLTAGHKDFFLFFA